MVPVKPMLLLVVKMVETGVSGTIKSLHRLPHIFQKIYISLGITTVYFLTV